MTKKVLIIEGDGNLHDQWFRGLRGKVGLKGVIALRSAMSLQEASDQFVANPDLAAIVVGTCDTKDRLDTVPFTQDARRTFQGPMIAAVDNQFHRRRLVSAGCDHASGTRFLPRKLVEVLG